MEEIPRLPDQYLANAREMVAKHKAKKNCKRCYDRGFLGVDQHNLLIPCPKCVAGDTLLVEWRQFVRDTPELAQLYGTYFEEEEATEQDAEQAGQPTKVNHPPGSNSDRQGPRGGSGGGRQPGRSHLTQAPGARRTPV